MKETSVNAIPIFANRRDVRLVRSDQTETKSAPIVASAQDDDDRVRDQAPVMRPAERRRQQQDGYQAESSSRFPAPDGLLEPWLELHDFPPFW